jgi:hypothetical protein
MTAIIRPAESDAAYPNIQLNARWRVIRCRADIQWILQHRHGPETGLRAIWDSRSYCHTKEALMRCSREHAGEIAGDALVILLRLPERVEVQHPGVAGVS